jgi:hypothetical protein
MQMLKYANGALLIVLCAAAGILLSPRIKKFPVILPVNIIAPAAFYLYCGLALAYVLYPNFSDHAEPAMATLGIILLQGRPLYPGLDDYSFHGLLYGPLIAEIQAGALFLGSAIGDLSVTLSSKLAGVLAFLLASGLFFRTARGWDFGRTYYTLYLLPFGILGFWNRSEPLFLLLVTFCFWIVETCGRRPALLALGICAGLASGLKLHGFLYIAPAAVLLMTREEFNLDVVLLPAVAAAAAFFLLYSPANVSLYSFFAYLLFGAEHGLSWQLFAQNLAFICALWTPLIVALAAVGRWRVLREPELLALAALQIAAAVVGAKPGAGIHHLLPFIPANALAFARHTGKDAARVAAVPLVWLAVLAPGAAVAGDLAYRMGRDWRTYERAREELLRIRDRHPDLVMGVGGGNYYPYTFLRPLLADGGPPQIEYSSYMDLKFVGVPDTPLVRAFESCEIRYLAMPKREPPFSLASYYVSGVPMFSDTLRDTFAHRFAKITQGTWYDTYECRR